MKSTRSASPRTLAPELPPPTPSPKTPVIYIQTGGPKYAQTLFLLGAGLHNSAFHGISLYDQYLRGSLVYSIVYVCRIA
jgi:hypothetical protein